MAKVGTARQRSQLDTETLTIEEQIRLRAHEIWVERGVESGSELDDWLQAEEEVRSAQGIGQGPIYTPGSVSQPIGCLNYALGANNSG
jgi:hypothetical protein